MTDEQTKPTTKAPQARREAKKKHDPQRELKQLYRTVAELRSEYDARLKLLEAEIEEAHRLIRKLQRGSGAA